MPKLGKLLVILVKVKNDYIKIGLLQFIFFLFLIKKTYV
jgi:hypothetical protein